MRDNMQKSTNIILTFLVLELFIFVIELYLVYISIVYYGGFFYNLYHNHAQIQTGIRYLVNSIEVSFRVIYISA